MGLAALVRARHRALARGASLRLVPPPSATRHVFELSRLDRLFTWVEPEAAG
jgi:anti-anti-sigma regulatory factor